MCSNLELGRFGVGFSGLVRIGFGRLAKILETGRPIARKPRAMALL